MKIGRRTPAVAPVDKAAAARLAAARRCRAWEEIPDDLVRRPLRYLVSASTDEAFRPYTAAAFDRDGNVRFAETQPLRFVVRAGDVLLLEPVGRTWSEIVEERARIEARA